MVVQLFLRRAAHWCLVRSRVQVQQVVAAAGQQQVIATPVVPPMAWRPGSFVRLDWISKPGCAMHIEITYCQTGSCDFKTSLGGLVNLAN